MHWDILEHYWNNSGAVVGGKLKWILAAAFAAVGLLLSFGIAPTVFECKLFTECHELNASYAMVSIFSSDVSSTLANEQKALQIAHSLALTTIFLLFGWGIGFAIERQNQSAGAPQTPVAPSPNRSREEERERGNNDIELVGLDQWSDYYLKIDATELAEMPLGLVIGRDSNCAVFIVNDDTVSRQHARLRVERGDFVIEDIGSANGTKINARELLQSRPEKLRSGDHVTFGSAVFAVRMI
ncbi:MAG: FHA domain-containing protein [Rhizomicrobium sp.]